MDRRKTSEERHRYEVEKNAGYEYIRSYFKGDELSDGSVIDRDIYIQVKHRYCGNVYEVKSRNFINAGQRCGKCCHKYENSFAYHIEQELGESLDKYWDFEKNTVSPYHISKGTHKKVYIKCQEKAYHESYEVSCDNFIKGRRCGYCGKHKVHPKDSFGQYLKDNDLIHLWSNKNSVDTFKISKSSGKKVWMLCDKHEHHNDYGGYEINCIEFIRGRKCSYCASRKIHPLDSFGQYLKDNNLLHLWSDKNTIDPFTISRSNDKKVWMLCDKHDYHNDYGGYEVDCRNFYNGQRCSYCSNRKVHFLDSFATNFPDKAKCWCRDNQTNPCEISSSSRKRIKFKCNECGNVWKPVLYSVSNGSWCPNCASSKGEKKVSKWLIANSVNYEVEKSFNNLIGSGGGSLRYDFYLPDHNLLIEYDGIQHDKWIKEWMTREDFKKLQYHDKLKNEYAKNNNIKLIRIKEKDFDNIEEVLGKVLKL